MRTARRLVPAAVVTAAVAVGVPVAIASPVAAHTKLVSAEPAPGATVAALEVVRLRFSEAVSPEFATVAVTGADGARVDSGPPAVAGAEISVPVTGAGGGTITVAYRVLSADGHPVAGSYGVTYAPVVAAEPSASALASASITAAEASASATTSAPSPSAPSPSAETTSADGTGTGTGTALVWSGGALLAGAVVAAAAFVRRRRSGQDG